MKSQLNVRMSAHGKALLRALAAYHGLSQAGVLEMLLRADARRQGVVATRTAERP